MNNRKIVIPTSAAGKIHFELAVLEKLGLSSKESKKKKAELERKLKLYEK